mgnify:FL=1
MRNRLINLKKPHIEFRDGKWCCGIFFKLYGNTPALAYAEWRKINP